MLPDRDGANINGPSLIRAPAWLPNRLGEFYLYFSHHAGTYIRLAVADNLEGPWRIHSGGSLRLADTPARGHVASPDVHVDGETRAIRMYFHGISPDGNRQLTWVGTSPDGLRFDVSPDSVATFYLRAVRWRGQWVGMAKGGWMYTSPSGLERFARLPEPAFPLGDPDGNSPGDVRHVALDLRGDDLVVYFTRIGDAPERILRARIDLSLEQSQWRAGEAEPVLRPEYPWEGADRPVQASRSGAAHSAENALRDPAIFQDGGRKFLLYTVCGEAGIAIAEIVEGAV